MEQREEGLTSRNEEFVLKLTPCGRLAFETPPHRRPILGKASRAVARFVYAKLGGKQ